MSDEIKHSGLAHPLYDPGFGVLNPDPRGGICMEGV